MNTITVGIVAAALSGITFIAYKHPREFPKLSFFMLILLGTVTMLAASYLLGVTVLREAVSWDDRFLPEVQAYVENIADNLQPPYWIWPITLFVQLYLLFLCLLSRFLESRKYKTIVSATSK